MWIAMDLDMSQRHNVHMSIKKHLQKSAPKKSRALIQAHVDAELAEKLKRRLAKEDVTMVRFIEAAILAYLEDT